MWTGDGRAFVWAQDYGAIMGGNKTIEWAQLKKFCDFTLTVKVFRKHWSVTDSQSRRCLNLSVNLSALPEVQCRSKLLELPQ